MVRSKGDVGSAKRFVKIRNFLRTDNRKDWKRLSQQISQDNLCNAEARFGLERFDALVSVYVLRMVKQSFHEV